MKLNKSTADLFVPDGTALPDALKRTTHLGIGAHQDDLEIMAFHGIVECYGRQDRWFTGVTCTNGAGSPRAGAYAHYTDAAMQQVRRHEQRAAAVVGQYAAMLQLDYSSGEAKDRTDSHLQDDLATLLKATRPQVVYVHNLGDKHETHVGVGVATIAALRSCAPADRPAKVYGCEVWRDLDWLADSEKVALDVTGHDNLAAALTGIFDSQVAGGKRYDLASLGRRRANATYFESHGVDKTEQVIFAMDLTPLVNDAGIDPVEYMTKAIRRFEEDVRSKLLKRMPK